LASSSSKKSKASTADAAALAPSEKAAIASQISIESRDPVRSALAAAASVASDAVEAYLASVVDPAIYNPLKQARDKSTEALFAFNNRL
jgi:hypothetical protein